MLRQACNRFYLGTTTDLLDAVIAFDIGTTSLTGWSSEWTRPLGEASTVC